MAKLNKMQAQAVINKLEREASALRKALLEKERLNYTPTPYYNKVAEYLETRDTYSKLAEEAYNKAKEIVDKLTVPGIYKSTSSATVLENLKNKEIEKRVPVVDMDDALDELIIQSIDEDFEVNNFINYYLDKMRNGK